MDEPLRKLKIDGGDLEQNNEGSFDLDDLLHPQRMFRIPRMSLTIPSNAEREAGDPGVVGI